MSSSSPAGRRRLFSSFSMSLVSPSSSRNLVPLDEVSIGMGAMGADPPEAAAADGGAGGVGATGGGRGRGGSRTPAPASGSCSPGANTSCLRSR
eukprot:5387275-Heterocapsa_arctica.AAC.1